MPNQRAKDRAFLGVFISKGLKRHLQENAQRAGQSVSALVVSLLEDALSRTAKTTAVPNSDKPAPDSQNNDRSEQSSAYNASINEDVWML